MNEQTPKRLLAVREKLYELLANCIPADMILSKLTSEIVKQVDDEMKIKTVRLAAYVHIHYA